MRSWGVSDGLLGGGGYDFSSFRSLHGIDRYATTLLWGRGQLWHDYDIVLRGALKKWTIWVSKHGTSDNKDTFFFTPDPLDDFICCLTKRST